MIEKSIDASVLLSIYEATVKIIGKNVPFVQKAGLSHQQWIILLHLAKDPNIPYLMRRQHYKPMMASELAESMGVSRANITNLLSVLMDKSLIRQIEDKEDRRIKRLVLTAKGENLIKSMQADRVESNKTYFVGLSSEEKEILLMTLQKITDNIINDWVRNVSNKGLNNNNSNMFRDSEMEKSKFITNQVKTIAKLKGSGVITDWDIGIIKEWIVLKISTNHGMLYDGLT